MLESHSGSEEVVFQQLLQLSSQEGVQLPVQTAAVSTLEHSVMSINTTVNESETLYDNLWNDLCMRLRRYFVHRLQNLPVSQTVPAIDLASQKRLLYVQSLCTLYPVKDIWNKYRSIRSQMYGSQLLSYGKTLKASLTSADDVDFEKGAQHFETLVLLSQAMIHEDFCLLNSGVFCNAVSTMEALNEIYLDKLLDEVASIADSLHNDLLNVGNKKQVKEQDHTKAVQKSSSELMSLTHFKGRLQKQQSKSLDSLLSRSESFTDLLTLPTDTIGVLVSFVNSVLNMDNYLQHLQSLMTWELSNVAVKSPHQRRLKSKLLIVFY